MITPSSAARIEHRRLDEVHNCVRPGCWQRAKAAFHVEAPLRLAGFDFAPGEFVDLCPDHAHELLDTLALAQQLGFDGSEDRTIMLGLLGETNPVDRLREWEPPRT